jgi:hypothetical protein
MEFAQPAGARKPSRTLSVGGEIRMPQPMGTNPNAGRNSPRRGDRHHSGHPHLLAGIIGKRYPACVWIFGFHWLGSLLFAEKAASHRLAAITFLRLGGLAPSPDVCYHS